MFFLFPISLHSLDDIFNVNLQEVSTICNDPDIVHSSNIHTHVIYITYYKLIS